MGTVFDLLAAFLFIATAALFLLRRRHESPPLTPYLLIGFVSVVGDWLGNRGGGVAAVAFLIAGAFLMLHLASEPFREGPDETPR